ncbi:MAG: glycerol-3-phosphate 1-O-acyltransferase PlsB [Succinivibrio sp.]|jgi:glycerol-3-phosphate O-acyltransferase|nr:glycerol-3-phosphate 1-O-acyltransferase PlsB [Succinivibrio sp.]
MLIQKILRFFFYWPFRLTTVCNPIPFEPLKGIKLDRSLPIAYVTVTSGVGNLMAVERLTEKLGLPSPFSPMRVGSRLGVRSAPRAAYLHNPRMFSAHGADAHAEKIFERWAEAYRSTGTDIQIIPISVIWSRNPGYNGRPLHGFGINNHTPSWRKFFNLIFQGRDNCTIVQGMVRASEVFKRFDGSPDFEVLKRLASIRFIQRARIIVGKPMPDRKKMIEELLIRPAVRKAVEQECLRTGQSPEEIVAKGRGIYEVMLSDPRYSLLHFLNCFISHVWKRIYHGQTVIGADRVRRLIANGHEIIYIPCHRSHMDYVLLSFVLFHEGLPMPQIASGDNLNFFPVGPIIRRCGSYFIRRKMKGDEFYITLFSEYLSLLFEYGYATEFFIEGGRSRTGRTLPPKTGMVAMAVESQLRGIERPITFVPVYLGYEHVSEVRSYMSELNGQAKTKENAWQLLGIFKRMRYYGRGYVTFGKPINIPGFLSEKVPGWREDIDPEGLQRPGWLRETVNRLADNIIRNLNGAAQANGINLCAMALISDNDHTMSMSKLTACLNLYLRLMKADENLHDLMPKEPAAVLIRQALELKKFRIYDVGEDMKFVRPSYGQTLQLTYFENNIVHLFALPALIANIIIRNGHITREDIRVHTRSIFYFLRHELYAPVDESRLDLLINRYINVFLQSGYITEKDGMIYLSGDGFDEFYILSRCIHLNLVRYLVAVTALRDTLDGTLKVDAFIEKCLQYAKRLPVDVTGNSPEFADPIVFKTMCATFVRHKYFTVCSDKTIKIDNAKVGKLAAACEPLLGARDVRILKGQNVPEI